MINMQRKLGKTEDELAALQASKPKGFWARGLGGRTSDDKGASHL
jgi:hypothetical protein